MVNCRLKLKQPNQTKPKPKQKQQANKEEGIWKGKHKITHNTMKKLSKKF